LTFDNRKRRNKLLHGFDALPILRALLERN
jgi:hypothetical protein